MNDASYVQAEIVQHLTTNAASLAVDARAVSVVPYVVSTSYKEEYPAVLIDDARIAQFERVVAQGGYYTFEVPIICVDKTDGTQSEDAQAKMRVSSLAVNVSKVLRTVPLKWMHDLAIQFDGDVAETGNKIKNHGLTVSIRALIIDCP